jgi:PAS domain-containing protein
VVSGWIGTALDVHDMREAQEQLRETANRLQLAHEAAGAGNWDADLVGWKTHLCPQSVRAHGLPEAHSGEIGLDDWNMLLHPDDIPRVRAEFWRATETRSTYSVEFRIRLPGGGCDGCMGSAGFCSMLMTSRSVLLA